jgi:putative alpha-1,2-mannosidase
MKKLLIATITLLSTISMVNDEEKYRHFPSLQSADIHTAMCNIKNYNIKLVAITRKVELTTEDMVKVHELTYTQEHAVNFLMVSLEQVSADLEDVHKASEILDQKIIKSAVNLWGQRRMALT